MSLNAILNTSLTGLFTNQEALRVTANNIANVNTEDYARIRVSQEALVLQGKSVGVEVAEVQRVVDEFIAAALRTSKSATGEFDIQNEFHARLQGILGKPDSDSSFSSQLDQVFTAVADLTLNPADALRRQQMMSEMKSFLDHIDQLAQQFQDLRADASDKIGENINTVNEALIRINELNPLLAREYAIGQETGGLEGQMDQALADLAEMMDITVNRQPNGSVWVSTVSGIPLVDTSLTQLEYAAPGVVSSGTTFPKIMVYRVDDETLAKTSSGTDLSPHIRSGELRGLMDLRDRQLVDLSLTLGEMAARVKDQFNAVSNAFTAVPPPNTLTGGQTFVSGTQAPGFTGQVTFAVADANGNLVNKVDIDFDGASPPDFNALIAQVNAGLGGDGTLSLVNGVMSFTATSATNGVVIADDETNPSSRGGRGFSQFFGMNDLIVSDEVGIYDTGLNGAEPHGMGGGEAINFSVFDRFGRELTNITVNATGTSYNDMIGELNNVAGLGAFFTFSLDAKGALSWQPTASYESIRLDVQTDSTDLGGTGVSFSEAFGIGDRFHANAARNLEIRNDIFLDPSLMATGVFDQAAAIGSQALTGGDQRGPLAYQNIETSYLDFAAAGELRATNTTLSQYVARFLGNTGLMAKRASDRLEDNAALTTELTERNADVSGVNMDEELANLVLYQNAYNAAARMLSSVQELYDSLLAAV